MYELFLLLVGTLAWTSSVVLPSAWSKSSIAFGRERAFHRNSHMVIAPSASIVSLNSIRNTCIVHATKLAENHWFVLDGSVVFQFMVLPVLLGKVWKKVPVFGVIVSARLPCAPRS